MNQKQKINCWNISISVGYGSFPPAAPLWREVMDHPVSIIPPVLSMTRFEFDES